MYSMLPRVNGVLMTEYNMIIACFIRGRVQVACHGKEAAARCDSKWQG